MKSFPARPRNLRGRETGERRKYEIKIATSPLFVSAAKIAPRHLQDEKNPLKASPNSKSRARATSQG